MLYDSLAIQQLVQRFLSAMSDLPYKHLLLLRGLGALNIEAAQIFVILTAC